MTKCYARQASDSMVCDVCRQSWDVNDPNEPQCDTTLVRDHEDTVRRLTLPHCNGHWQFEYDCIECADAHDRARRISATIINRWRTRELRGTRELRAAEYGRAAGWRATLVVPACAVWAHWRNILNAIEQRATHDRLHGQPKQQPYPQTAPAPTGAQRLQNAYNRRSRAWLHSKHAKDPGARRVWSHQVDVIERVIERAIQKRPLAAPMRVPPPESVVLHIDARIPTLDEYLRQHGITLFPPS